MKICCGKWKGQTIYSPKSKNVRPTNGVVKQALFDMVDPSGAVLLDLFAGSGAVSFEALSCGADRCFLSDFNKECIDICFKNAKKLGCNDSISIFCLNANSMIQKVKKKGISFDIIFIDPPYTESEDYKILIADCIDICRGLIIVESNCDINIPDNVSSWKSRRYGDTLLSILEK